MINNTEDFRKALLDILLRYSQELNALRNEVLDMDGDTVEIGTDAMWKCLKKAEREATFGVSCLLGNARGVQERKD